MQHICEPDDLLETYATGAALNRRDDCLVGAEAFGEW